MLSVQSLIREVPIARRARGGSARPAEDPKLREAIDALPDPARVALALRCYEGVSLPAIASILDLTEEGARSLLLEAARAVTERLRRRSETPADSRRARREAGA
jgi:DNA-directed RNA polymerase specialized sigma24 family protein